MTFVDDTYKNREY